jgi:sigma-54 specific flagellar transcriptional regulator A
MTVGRNKLKSCLEAEIIGTSPAVHKLRSMIERVARSNASVLICGPSGSGKELVARAIHNLGSRSEKPFSAINCGAIPSELIESELFGHEKGAFTGATARRIGHFEASEGGSIFLDEIGDMRFEMQVKLLRVLEDRTIVRVGSSEMRPVDVRVISATHQNLNEAIVDGRFREDLFFRLGVVVLPVPTLEGRAEDIPALIRHFQSGMVADEKCRFDDGALAVLMKHRWPGNVRELRNFVDRASVLHGGETLTARDVAILLDPTAAMSAFAFGDQPVLAAAADGMHSRPDLVDAMLSGNFAADIMNAAADAAYGSGVAQDIGEGQHFDPAFGQGFVSKPAPGRPIDLKREIETLELEQIHAALDVADGIISEAARLLTLKRTTLIEKMRKYGVQLQAA